MTFHWSTWQWFYVLIMCQLKDSMSTWCFLNQLNVISVCVSVSIGLHTVKSVSLHCVTWLRTVIHSEAQFIEHMANLDYNCKMLKTLHSLVNTNVYRSNQMIMIQFEIRFNNKKWKSCSQLKMLFKCFPQVKMVLKSKNLQIKDKSGVHG